MYRAFKRETYRYLNNCEIELSEKHGEASCQGFKYRVELNQVGMQNHVEQLKTENILSGKAVTVF